MRRKKVLQFSAPGSETASIPLKSPEGGEEAGDVEEQRGTRGGSEVAETGWAKGR